MNFRRNYETGEINSACQSEITGFETEKGNKHTADQRPWTRLFIGVKCYGAFEGGCYYMACGLANIKKRILKRQESGGSLYGILRSLKRKAKGGTNSGTNNTACGAFRRIKNIHLFLLSFLSPGQRARWTALLPQLDSIKTSILRPNNLTLHAKLLPDGRGNVYV